MTQRLGHNLHRGQLRPFLPKCEHFSLHRSTLQWFLQGQHDALPLKKIMTFVAEKDESSRRDEMLLKYSEIFLVRDGDAQVFFCPVIKKKRAGEVLLLRSGVNSCSLCSRHRERLDGVNRIPFFRTHLTSFGNFKREVSCCVPNHLLLH